VWVITAEPSAGAAITGIGINVNLAAIGVIIITGQETGVAG
jgi:hypothetical protein